MPQYLSPGVYVEEIETGPQPITGVSTSITGAVGVTVKGPTSGKPQLVTSFSDFTTQFGGYYPLPAGSLANQWSSSKNNEGGAWWDFAYAVKGFFDNGGEQMYVKRVFSSTAIAAGGSLGQGLVAGLASDAAAGATVIRLTHLINVYVGVNLQLFQSGGINPLQIGANFTVTAYNATTGQVTLNTPITQSLVASRGDFAQIQPLMAPGANPTLIFSAAALGQWGNDLSVEVLPMVGTTMNITADPTIANNAQASTVVVTTVNAAGPPPTTTVTVQSVAGFNNGDHIWVAGQEYTVSAVGAGPPATFEISPPLMGGQTWPPGTVVTRLRIANVANAAPTINVASASSLYTGAIVELDNNTSKETFTVLSTAGSKVTLSGNLQNVYYEGDKLRVIEAQVNVQYAPADGNGGSETFSNLQLISGSDDYIVTYVNDNSNYVTVVTGPGYSNSLLAKFPTASSGSWQVLAGGDDQIANLSVEDFVGVDGGSGKRTGIQALEDITQISICIVPGMWSTTVQQALITHCETMLYRFAILDPPNGLSIEDIMAFREPIDTEYAALYYPWVQLLDPVSIQDIDIPPSGHMAGIYAQTDDDRGVFKAPANVVVQGITQFAQDVTKREQDLLNPVGINALRYFPDRGYRVWGARTLSSDTEWQYINVRRLFIYVEASIDQGTQWVVFEPNDQTLWARVTQTITNFLTTTWQSGALFGSTADQAFFVKCDATTMTQDDLDNGRLICLIGIAPVKPAEFVIFRIQQYTQPASTSS
jgi:uncharacterized protein